MENSLKLEYCKNYDNWCEKEKRSCKNCYYERGYNMSDKEIKDKMIKLMAEQLTTPIHSKKDVIDYFENLAKESGEIDERRKREKNKIL